MSATPAGQWGRRLSWRHLHLFPPHHPARVRTRFARYIIPIWSNISGVLTYVHATTVYSSNFTKRAVQILRFVNQETDGVTDDTALDQHQAVGHSEHLGNISCQPLREVEKVFITSFIHKIRKKNMWSCVSPSAACNIQMNTKWPIGFAKSELTLIAWI